VANEIGMTLEEAIATGQGTERPFRCFEHDDSTASASVNVIKNVWYCHACHASGAVDSKRVPKLEELAAMLTPEETCRVYPEAFSELYSQANYWHTRFAPWVCWDKGLGEDPFTGDATFPVHTPGGKYAGVGRRRVVVEDVVQEIEGEPINLGTKRSTRYLYPKNWSASMTLFGMAGRYPSTPVLALVEGAADATAVWEVGCPAFAVYGAGLHLPQRELLARFNPKVILLGFDMDEAGERAVSRAFKDLRSMAALQRVRWTEKDPGELPPDERRKLLARAVRRTDYGVDVVTRWDQYTRDRQEAYRRAVEGDAA
jgi:hypothetical protein